jgi:N-acyl-D-aspartate/D-glutamate deacylase
MSLEELHWRLSAHPAICAGFRNRGTLVEGAWADIVVYHLNKLTIKPMEIVHDFPGGEWRHVQQAEGYHAITVNGEVTFEEGRCTNATLGRLYATAADLRLRVGHPQAQGGFGSYMLSAPPTASLLIANNKFVSN